MWAGVSSSLVVVIIICVVVIIIVYRRRDSLCRGTATQNTQIVEELNEYAVTGIVPPSHSEYESFGENVQRDNDVSYPLYYF